MPRFTLARPMNAALSSETRLVLGVSDNSINVLKELDVEPSDEIDISPQGKETFIDLLKKNLNFK